MCSQSCSVLDVIGCGDVHSGLFYDAADFSQRSSRETKVSELSQNTPQSSVSGLYEMSQGGNTCNMHLL